MTSLGRKSVYRRIAVCLLGLASLLPLSSPAWAASGTKASSTTNWDQRDTAVYVVSTLNLLRNHNGRPASAIYARRYNVTKDTVLADTKSDGLYFVELKRDDGSTFGAYAYQMGWTKPMALTSSVQHYGAHAASSDIAGDYRADPKQLIATFSSTLPQ